MNYDFTPNEQLLNITSYDGIYEISLAELDDYFHTQLKSVVIFGVRIGAATLAMLGLFIVSKNKKTPVFILNQICLFFVILHSALFLGYLFGDYATITFQFTRFPQLISQTDKNISNAASFMAFFLRLFIEISFVFQVHTMFKINNSLKNLFGTAILSLSILTALAVIGLDLFNCVQLVQISQNSITSYDSLAFDVKNILFASSVNFMSVLLIAKLIIAIRARRYLGLKQFDGFHILLIMTSQSMILPSIILIVSYTANYDTEIPIGALSTLIVALSLPLSSMWAASANNSKKPTSFAFSSSNRDGDPSFYSNKTFAADGLSKKIIDENHHHLYTPSTVAVEESRGYWYDDDNDLEANFEQNQFLSKTTHEFSNN